MMQLICNWYLQVLQLHLGTNQLLICVLNFSYVSFFNSGGSGTMFQMWVPKTLTLLSPNVTEFWIGTLRSSLYL